VTPTEIGIRLTVKPLIGNDGSVQLEIAQDVSDVIGEVTVDGNPQPIIGKRETKSFVSVRSGEIIVLGGLQRTSKGKTTSRLGPVPIIGDLLGTRKRTDNRTDLVFFLRPYVLTNTPADNTDAYRRLEAGPQRDAVRQAIGPSFQGNIPPDLPPASPKP
jgi:general secretion pathway protein D